MGEMTAVSMPVQMQTTGSGRNMRYPVLDALRFVLALWVTVGHYAVFPLFAGADTATKLGRTLVHGWSSIVFGTPAVIVFFVISGFCIHLPFRNRKKLTIARYYARRYTRILIPLAGGIVAFKLLADKRIALFDRDSILWSSILWSLLCEEIYYAIYPLLRHIRNRFGWTPLLILAFGAGSGVSASHGYAADWSPYGPIGTSLILLPVWLLGCLLAEQVDTLPVISSSFVIWKWRFFCWFASWVSEMLHFKFHVSLTHSMILFGVVAYFWVKKELSYGMHKRPWGLLVSAGAWSYSLYLIHGPVIGFLNRWQPPNFGYIVNWCFACFLMLGTSYVFYRIVERPSHEWARRIRVTEDLRPGPGTQKAYASSTN